MLERTATVLLVIDVQERLLPHILQSQALTDKIGVLIAAARRLPIPILLTEQNPRGLGPTVPTLQALLAGVPAIEKHSFSCCREPRFQAALEALGRRQVLLCGIETHVCIQQTALDLLARGFRVQAPADAVGARSTAAHASGLAGISQAGGEIGLVESALFELLATAACPEFKPILQLIKKLP